MSIVTNHNVYFETKIVQWIIHKLSQIFYCLSKKSKNTKTLIHKLYSRNNLALDNFFLKYGGMILLNFNFEDVYSQYAKRDLNKKLCSRTKSTTKCNKASKYQIRHFMIFITFSFCSNKNLFLKFWTGGISNYMMILNPSRIVWHFTLF